MTTAPTRGEPRGDGRRWRIAWALAVTQTIGYGVLFYAYGVLTVPMETALGWTRTQTSGAFSLALLTSGLAALTAGRIVDRHGGRGLMTIGSLAVGALRVASGDYGEGLVLLTLFALAAAAAIERARQSGSPRIALG